MSSLVKFNPQSQSFVSRAQNGGFETKAVARQGIVNNEPSGQPGPKVLSQSPKPAGNAVKILY